MNLAQMQKIMVFCLWAKSRSTTVVCRLLDVHRSSVLRAIRGLENELNVKLVDTAGPHLMKLTPAGELLYKRYANSVDVITHLQQPKDFSFLKEAKPVLNLVLPINGVHYYIESDAVAPKDFTLDLVSFNYEEIIVSPYLLMDKLSRAHLALLPLDLHSPYLNDNFKSVGSVDFSYRLYTYKDYLEAHSITAENYRDHVFCVTPYNYKRLSLMKGSDPIYIVENQHLLGLAHQKARGVILSTSYSISARHDCDQLVNILSEITHEHPHGLFIRQNLNDKFRHLANQMLKTLLPLM